MTVALLGFAWDRSSSYAQGAAMAPRTIESLLFCDASGPYSLDGTNVSTLITSREFPDLTRKAAASRDRITACVSRELEQGRTVISLGGDHSVTFPILRAFRDHHGPLDVLHVDAHPDIYDVFEGDRYSHASPFARALESGCIRHLVQVGIRAAAPEHRAMAKRHDVLMLGADALDRVPDAIFAGPLYLSIDLDGLDPAFAPGVSHPEPGGLTTREVLGLIARIRGPLVGADIVELNPERDQNLQTAAVAVRLVKEIAATMVARPRVQSRKTTVRAPFKKTRSSR
jgi:agmatinase